MMLSSKIKFMDYMACVQAFDQSLCLDLHVVIEVSVIANVKVPRYFFYCEGADESAAILVLDCFSYCLQLPKGILLSEKLVAPSIKIGTIAVQPPLLNRAYVGVMGDHDIFEVETDELAGEGGKLNVDIDAE